MNSLFFWKQWHKEYRYTWYVAAGIFILSMLFLWFAYFQGEDAVIQWNRLQEQKILETTVHSFRLGPFELNVPAETYTIFEYFNGSHLSPNTVASYLFLTILAAGAVIILSVIATLQKFWYFIGMGLFILFVISLRLEVLGIFGLYNRIPVVLTLLLFIVPSFYFSRFRTATPFLARVLTFLILTVLVALAIAFFSAVDLPFYHLTLTGFVSGLVLSVLFIIMVAHEILAALANLISQGSSKSLNHMLIISVIYLANVLLTCLHEMNIIQWDFLYINLYLLLTISAVLGLWGFRQREILYGNIIPFYPLGAFFFVSLGAICFATTAQLLGNANDPGLKILRDVIAFSHMGFGFIFLTYLFSNFAAMLAQNLPIHKVLYNPNRMPYFTFRFAGLIVMLGFVFSSNWREYVYHGLSAFYNSAGDLYTLLDNDAYAESFYNQGRAQGFQNHRSNYALATLRGARFNFNDAHYNYALANAKHPSAYSLTNAGNLYLWENKVTDAIAAYRVGLKKMPESGRLTNNLGFAYAKLHHIDSATYFLNQAREFAPVKDAAETNFFGLAAQEFVPLNPDSVLAVFKTSSPGTLSNALALATVFNKSLDVKIDPLAKKKLNLYTATFLNNYIIKNVKSLDTTFIHEAYRIASDEPNEHFSEALKASLAFAFYHQGNITKALEILGELAYISQSYQGKFNYIMGLWALEQGNPLLAASYFSYADTYDYKEARFYHAIALTEAGKRQQALASWDSVLVQGDPFQHTIAERIKRILTVPAAKIVTGTDAERYQFCRYRIGLRDSVLFNRIAHTFENANYKAQALLDLSKKYFEAGHILPAIQYFRRIGGLELTDKRLYEHFKHFELLLLAHRRELNTLAQQINQGIQFDPSRSLQKTLYTALLNEASNDTVAAKKHYTILATYNPYFEEGIIAAFEYFQKRNPDDMNAYSILAEAVQINAHSIRLWKAYYKEATRIGLDEYAQNALQHIRELEDIDL